MATKVTMPEQAPGTEQDRRQDLRLPGCGIILVRPKLESGKALARSAKIVDLSKTGIAFRLNHRFPAGTILTLAPIGWAGPPSLIAKVVHNKDEDGLWLHGCEFVTKLNRRDLERLFSFNLKNS
jgi:hypothetical protein